MATTHCYLCHRDIRNNNYTRHAAACRGPKIKKVRGIDFDPNIGYKNGTRSPWNKGLSKETDERLKRYGATTHARYECGELTPFGCCDPEWVSTNRAVLVNNGREHGGYKEGAGRSQKFWMPDSFGTIVCLQSSYEKRMAEILDTQSIRWVRPKAFRYDDGRLYYPDFYLIDYDIFLDPKNSWLVKRDIEKIRKVMEQNNIDVRLVLKEDLALFENTSVAEWLGTRSISADM